MMPTRDDALALMESWTESDSLRKHMLAVEAAVAAYAREQGEDETLWSVAAILHDFDYERYPNPDRDESGHPWVGVAKLKELGYPEEVTDAILGHADYTGVPRRTPLARTLFACDEITGLVTAAVLVRPDRDIANQTVKSLKKKFKDKAFARSVDRGCVYGGAEAVGRPLPEHIGFLIESLKPIAAEIGL